MKLSEQLLAMMPKKEKENPQVFMSKFSRYKMEGRNEMLADVKAILSKVEVDKEKLIEIIGNTKTTSADGVTKYKTIDILGLCELDEIASAIAKDLPIKE